MPRMLEIIELGSVGSKIIKLRSTYQTGTCLSPSRTEPNPENLEESPSQT